MHANLQAAPLVALALQRGEGKLSADGALVVRTGTHTGRSAQDKFVVAEPGVSQEVWWGSVNQKLSPAGFAALTETVRGYLQGQTLFVEDLYAGAAPAHRIRLRLVTTNAWHALFARNMFIRPSPLELQDFAPDYVILHAPDLPSIQPLWPALDHGGGFVLRPEADCHFRHQYAGEIKKSIFSVMNLLLPAKGVLPMHCSANVGSGGVTALFFGLSGTGKTTLSADPDAAAHRRRRARLERRTASSTSRAAATPSASI